MDPGSQDPHFRCLPAAHSCGSPAGHHDIYTELSKAHVASSYGFLSSHTYYILLVAFSFLQDKTIGKSILFCWELFSYWHHPKQTWRLKLLSSENKFYSSALLSSHQDYLFLHHNEPITYSFSPILSSAPNFIFAPTWQISGNLLEPTRS